MPERFEIVSQSIAELSAWPGAEQALEAFVSKARARGDTVLDIAPHRYWLINGQAPVNGEFAITDLSHGHQCLRLAGDDRFDVLAGGLPIDIDPANFPVGSVATSVIETTTVTVHNCDDAFDIYCRRSYADSLAEWIKSALLQH